MLLPGFQDAHIHPPGSGLEMLRCNLTELYVLDAYERIIAEYAAANPDAPWILGGGWYMDVFPGGTPTKEALDAIVPDRPAFLTNRDGHGAWVNSRALELAGITRDTPDPRGRAHRTQPRRRAVRHAARGRDEPRRRRRAGRHRRGLRGRAPRRADATSTRSASPRGRTRIVGIDDGYRTFDTYVRGGGRAASSPPGWSGRSGGTVIAGSSRSSGSSTPRARATVGRFAPTSVKIMQDGVIENFTAATLTPYLDAHGEPTDNAGHLVRRSGAAEGGRDAAGRARASRRTSTRWATARCASRWTRSRPR